VSGTGTGNMATILATRNIGLISIEYPTITNEVYVVQEYFTNLIGP
jgi:hypothetical protein